MDVTVAKTAGFCFGVSRAVKIVTELLDGKTGEKIYTLGPIIHNSRVINDLQSKGAIVINDIDEAEPGSILVIRAHGISEELYRAIEGKDLKVIDTTCPYVKKIHRVVNDNYRKGNKVIIVGDPHHPEVIGINGWAGGRAVIVDKLEDAGNMDESDESTCVVSQTTITREKWESVLQILRSKFKNIIIFDTICSATVKRQREAEELAGASELMIVVGSRDSSNTQKLYEVCKKNCKNTYLIEYAREIDNIDVRQGSKVCITAGASTPDWIIKEVIEKMEELNTHENEINFKEAFERSLVTLNSGEIVKGRVISYNDAEVYIDMGYKSDGIIPADELSGDTDVKPKDLLKIGDEVDVYVVRVNDGEGNVLLSMKKAESMRGWDKLEAAFEGKAVLQGKVVELVNGGIIAVVNEIRVFVPASQVSDRYVKDLSEFVKKPISLRIIDINKQKRKVVGSARVILEEEKQAIKSSTWDNIEIGKVCMGTVRRLADFGAFVDIGGVDGLIHISEMSWKKIKHPSEVLNVDDTVEVTVLGFDKEKNRVSLGLRKAGDNPWVKAGEKYKAGEVVKGKVIRLVPFGAFVELESSVDGLVHISQISNRRIGKPGDVLEIGQEVDVKIIDINLESQKISLSIKEANSVDAAVPEQEAEKQEVQEAEKQEVQEAAAEAVKETSSYEPVAQEAEACDAKKADEE